MPFNVLLDVLVLEKKLDTYTTMSSEACYLRLEGLQRASTNTRKSSK